MSAPGSFLEPMQAKHNHAMCRHRFRKYVSSSFAVCVCPKIAHCILYAYIQGIQRDRRTRRFVAVLEYGDGNVSDTADALLSGVRWIPIDLPASFQMREALHQPYFRESICGKEGFFPPREGSRL